jgi:branched-chain amino acid transport system ATP-binding protein
MLLAATNLSKRFGGVAAVRRLEFHLDPGEILAIIGPNGAGKTTVLNLLSGVFPADEGRIVLDGVDITRLPAEDRCHLGLGRAFQVVQPFPEMTVRDNLMVGALFGSRQRSLAEARRRTDEVLALTGLAGRAAMPARDLTLAWEKRVEMARAIATSPRVLLLDEVMAGLLPQEADEMLAVVRSVRETGVAVLFIEHVMRVVRDLADRVIVMDFGEKIAEGSYREVTGHPRVIEAYLGSEETSGA